MCGVVGIIGSESASKEVYRALVALQHRGQDAAGIVSFDPNSSEFHLHKDMGLVSQVFHADNLESLKGSIAIGHTRYSTIGHSRRLDLQPLILNQARGIGMVHNGNLVNYSSLAQEMNQEYMRPLLTKNDVEVLQNLLADELVKDLKNINPEGIRKAVSKVMTDAKGAYSVIANIGSYMIAFRDPHGIRPLMYGKRDRAYCFASESQVFYFTQFQYQRDVQPGELIVIDPQGEFYSFQLKQAKKRNCMFEWVYFAGAESVISETSVYKARLQLGQELAAKIKPLIQQGKIKPDVVAPVPDTSRTAAIALAEALSLPYREVLIKNRYVHRSFILNRQEDRKLAVGLKLAPVEGEVQGKNVLLVDDSIVRGTTSKKMTQLVRDAGAKDVYFASTCPPILNPCYYGIDFPSSEELVAHHKNEEQIADAVGANAVIYQDHSSLRKALQSEELCDACLSGSYPVPVEKDAFMQGRVKT